MRPPEVAVRWRNRAEQLAMMIEDLREPLMRKMPGDFGSSLSVEARQAHTTAGEHPLKGSTLASTIRRRTSRRLLHSSGLSWREQPTLVGDGRKRARFAGFAALALQDPKAAAAELERAIGAGEPCSSNGGPPGAIRTPLLARRSPERGAAAETASRYIAVVTTSRTMFSAGMGQQAWRADGGRRRTSRR
jgi:hypothetical protein